MRKLSLCLLVIVIILFILPLATPAKRGRHQTTRINHMVTSGKAKGRCSAHSLTVTGTTGITSAHMSNKRSPSGVLSGKKSDELFVDDLVLHKRPLKTLWFSVLYGWELLKNSLHVALQKGHRLYLVLSIVLICALSYFASEELFWYGKWMGLGILSSIGFGTGLHTFVLFLGPQIARTTMKAFYCDNLLVPIGSESLVKTKSQCSTFQDPFPEAIRKMLTHHVNIFTVFAKISLIALAWGAGTAIGELPPYFLAKAGSGEMTKEEEGSDSEDTVDSASNTSSGSAHGKKKKPLLKRLMSALEKNIGGFITKYRWKAILPFAAIPNPAFDLAGVTCGLVGIPFWEFFLPTLVGKACIKAQLQSIFIVLLFSDNGFTTLMQFLDRWEFTQAVKNYILREKEKFSNPEAPQETMVGFVWDAIIKTALFYFAWHAIEHFAKAYAHNYKGLRHKPKEKLH